MGVVPVTPTSWLLAIHLFDALVLARTDVDMEEESAFTPTVSAGPGFIAVSGALP